MKYLLVLGVLGVALWLWRHNRQDEVSSHTRPTQRPQKPGNMVACQYCGTHLPETDAVRGLKGYYCDPRHQQLAEG